MVDHKEAFEFCKFNEIGYGAEKMPNLCAAYLELRQLAQAYLDAQEPTHSASEFYKAQTALRGALKNE